MAPPLPRVRGPRQVRRMVEPAAVQARRLRAAYRFHHKLNFGAVHFCPWCGTSPRDARWDAGWCEEACPGEVPLVNVKIRILAAVARIPRAQVEVLPPAVRNRVVTLRAEASTRGVGGEANTLCVQGPGPGVPALRGDCSGVSEALTPPTFCGCSSSGRLQLAVFCTELAGPPALGAL